MQTVKVIGRSVEPKGAMEGSYNHNHMLNSFLCDVDFPDSQVKDCSANVIAEKMACRIDSDSFLVTML